MVSYPLQSGQSECSKSSEMTHKILVTLSMLTCSLQPSERDFRIRIRIAEIYAIKWPSQCTPYLLPSQPTYFHSFAPRVFIKKKKVIEDAGTGRFFSFDYLPAGWASGASAAGNASPGSVSLQLKATDPRRPNAGQPPVLLMTGSRSSISTHTCGQRHKPDDHPRSPGRSAHGRVK